MRFNIKIRVDYRYTVIDFFFVDKNIHRKNINLTVRQILSSLQVES